MSEFQIGSDQMICRVPIEMLFCESDEFLGNTLKNASRPQAWHDVHVHSDGLSILSLRSHIRLFEGFFEPDKLDVSFYKNWWNAIHAGLGVNPPKTADERIFDRYDYFSYLNGRFAANGIDDDAFLLDGEYDPATGRFVLRDGHHRAAYLIARRERWANARMSAASHAALCDADRGALARQMLPAEGASDYYQPVEHPLLPPSFAHRDNFFPNRLSAIADALGYLRPASVLDIGSNIGYFSRHFSRSGARAVGVEPQEPHYNIAVALNALFQTNCDLRMSTAEEAQLGDEVFDIGIVLTVLYHFLNRPEIAIAMAQLIDKHVAYYLFWESGSDIDREVAFMAEHTGFGFYKRLRFTIGTGRVRELGVFARSAEAIEELTSYDPYRNFLADQG